MQFVLGLVGFGVSMKEWPIQPIVGEIIPHSPYQRNCPLQFHHHWIAIHWAWEMHDQDCEHTKDINLLQVSLSCHVARLPQKLEHLAWKVPSLRDVVIVGHGRQDTWENAEEKASPLGAAPCVGGFKGVGHCTGGNPASCCHLDLGTSALLKQVIIENRKVRGEQLCLQVQHQCEWLSMRHRLASAGAQSSPLLPLGEFLECIHLCIKHLTGHPNQE